MGGILLGAARPVHILTPSSTVRRIVNMTALAVVDARAQRRGERERPKPARLSAIQEDRMAHEAIVTQVVEKKKSRSTSRLYFQVIVAIVIGVLLGHFYPETGAAMKPLGDGFIKLIKMIIAPIIFCTVVVGIAGMEDMKKVGKTGGYALLYFEIVSTHRAGRRPGDRQRRAARRGHEHRPGDARHQGRSPPTPSPGKMQSTTDFLLNVIPSTVVDAFAKGEILQVLLFSVLFGFALHQFGGRGTLVFDFIEKMSHVLFAIVGFIMKVAPIGAFGAMAFTIGKYGVGSLLSLGKLMGDVLRSPASCSSSSCSGIIARAARLRHLEVHQVHQGRAADRARHVVVRIGAAAHDGQAGEPRASRSRPSAW